ncbi:MAG: uroporphyrinogen-III synthase [Pseudomonadales bacterium]|nr:uroporphyrinogen-III synthase [Pseudomonadales bacterium]
MLNGISVIVTRPQAQANVLKKILAGMGAEILAIPGLEIFPVENAKLETTCLDLDRFQHVIFTSANAAHIGMAKLDEYWPQWPVGIEWYAVGDATAKVLAEYTIQAHLPDKHSSEGLLALSRLQELAAQKILIVKGVGGRTLLTDTLKARGAELVTAEVYKRVCPPINIGQQTQVEKVLDAGTPLVMVVSSVETLENLEILLAPSWAGLQQKPLVVVSERIAQHAKEKGFQHVRVSSRPDDASVIDTLKPLFSHQ